MMNRLNRKDNQMGRSMLEMLGVLAVIGVLSVGGLTTYKYTMRRHRITTTIQQVSLAMQSARGLALKKIDSTDVDEITSGDETKWCLSNISWVMQGMPQCTQLSGAVGFQTSIGACVSICRDNRNIWFLDMPFEDAENPENIITKTDCENILMSEIAKDGFFNLDDNIKNRNDSADIQAICNTFLPSDNDDTTD